MSVNYITSEVGTRLLNSNSNSGMQNTDGRVLRGIRETLISKHGRDLNRLPLRIKNHISKFNIKMKQKLPQDESFTAILNGLLKFQIF